MPMVQQNMGQQNNNQHTAPSTPQSQTPTTPLHGGPPTPTPVVHHSNGPNQPPTPTPQQAVMFAPNMQHGGAGTQQHYVIFHGQNLHQGGHVHPNQISQNAGGGHHHVIPSSQGVNVHGNPTLVQQNTLHNFQNAPPPPAGRG